MNYLLLLRKISLYGRNKRGLWRLSHYLRTKYASYPKEIIISDFDGNLFFKCFLHLHIGSQIFWNGCYSCSQLYLLDRILKNDMVYVDVGANVGEQTIYAAKRLTKGYVFCFEPTTIIYKCLVDNINLNRFSNVKAMKLALGEKNDKLPIFISEKTLQDGTTNEGVPTLYPFRDRNKLLEIIDVKPFDELVTELQLKRLDVMKIDVEGAEMSVTRGSENTIKRFKPIIIIEVYEGTCQSAGYEPNELLKYLKSFGYRIEGLLPNGKTRVFSNNELNSFRDMVCYPC